MPLAIGILSAIAQSLGCEVQYFETSFYQKRGSVPEERERTGEFKISNRNSSVKLLSYQRLKKDFIEIIENFRPDLLAVTANSIEFEKFEELIDGIELMSSKPFECIQRSLLRKSSKIHSLTPYAEAREKKLGKNF